jgi:hypothetical protein
MFAQNGEADGALGSGRQLKKTECANKEVTNFQSSLCLRGRSKRIERDKLSKARRSRRLWKEEAAEVAEEST